MLFGIIFSNVTKKQTLPTKPWNLKNLISFMVSLWFFFFFNLQNDAGNFISLGFHFISWFGWKWVGPKVGFCNHNMWIISPLEAGSSLQLCYLISSPWSAALAGLIMKCGPSYQPSERLRNDRKKNQSQRNFSSARYPYLTPMHLKWKWDILGF